MDMPINEGILQFISWKAAQKYDHKALRGLFNLACWSEAYCEITGRQEVLDGNIVRAILTGRNWVKPSQAGSESHWELKKPHM